MQYCLVFFSPTMRPTRRRPKRGGTHRCPQGTFTKGESILTTLSPTNAVAVSSTDQRYSERYGDANSITNGSILSIAEDVLRANGGEATFEQIIDAVMALCTINNDLRTAMRAHCERKSVSLDDLTDEEVDEIIVREVRRRVCSAINQDNAAGRFRKKAVDPRRRTWNGQRENWFGADAGKNQEVIQLPTKFNETDETDPTEEPPTERKRRGRRAALDLRVASVEPRQDGDGTVVDAVLVDTKGRPVGVASLADNSDGKVMRVEGKIDQAGTDMAAREIFRSLGATGDQEYEVRQVSVRTVTVAPLPSAADILAELRQKKNGTPESVEAVQKEGSRDAGETASQEPESQDQGESSEAVVEAAQS